jgi:selenocysteine lyase/cysteine desulfurase
LDGIGLDTVHQRVSALTGWLLRRLGGLRHGNGAPVVRIYGPSTMDARGGTVVFNVLAPAGRIVDERIVSRDATAGHISLRTGCFCNPGAVEGAFDIPVAAVTGSIGRRPRTIDEYLELLGLPSAGAIRVSLGIASNLADVERLIGFAASYRDAVPDRDGLSPRLRC